MGERCTRAPGPQWVTTVIPPFPGSRGAAEVGLTPVRAVVLCYVRFPLPALLRGVCFGYARVSQVLEEKSLRCSRLFCFCFFFFCFEKADKKCEYAVQNGCG